MILYPNIYLKNVKEITLDLLEKNNIKGIILDVDNTLIDFNKNILEEVDIWVNNMKKYNIKLCILSNTNKIDKVIKVAKYLDLEYINFAKKPLKSGFKKAIKILRIKRKKHCCSWRSNYDRHFRRQ
jgi:HAD superfamily phosphatase (TIGR01668 family)